MAAVEFDRPLHCFPHISSFPSYQVSNVTSRRCGGEAASRRDQRAAATTPLVGREKRAITPLLAPKRPAARLPDPRWRPPRSVRLRRRGCRIPLPSPSLMCLLLASSRIARKNNNALFLHRVLRLHPQSERSLGSASRRRPMASSPRRAPATRSPAPRARPTSSAAAASRMMARSRRSLRRRGAAT